MEKIAQVTLYILIGIFLVVGIFSLALLFQKNTEENIYECQADADCIKIQTSCCPCSMGGEEKCIPKSRQSFFQEQIENCQRDIVCPAVYNCNIAGCKCVNETCQQS